MSRVCELTGKGRQVGNNVSHANNKTKRVFKPNLQPVRALIDGQPRSAQATATERGASRLTGSGPDARRAQPRLAVPQRQRRLDDADQAGGCHFLVMEFIEGKSLAALVARVSVPATGST